MILFMGMPGTRAWYIPEQRSEPYGAESPT